MKKKAMIRSTASALLLSVALGLMLFPEMSTKIFGALGTGIKILITQFFLKKTPYHCAHKKIIRQSRPMAALPNFTFLNKFLNVLRFY